MEIFAPHNLPGVGMGNLTSLAGLLGMVGLAVTSGMLVAEGVLGTLVFVASAVAVLSAKPDLGGSPAYSIAALALLVVLLVVRLLLARRAARTTLSLVGSAPDAAETRTARAAAARSLAWSVGLTIASVAFAGALVGFAWAEWNEIPFEIGDTESLVGLGVGLVTAAIGGDAAFRFLQGAVRAGGSSAVVGTVIAVAAYALNTASFYVPFVGGVVLIVAIVLAIRLRRRQERKYAGLRILS